MKHRPQAGSVVLTPNEVRRVIGGINDTMIQVVLLLVYFCELPLAEVVKIKKADIDLKQNCLWIHSRWKTDMCCINISEPALFVITTWLHKIKSDMWLFPCNKSHISTTAILTALDLASEITGIPASINSIQNSFSKHVASYTLEYGNNISQRNKTIEKYMGKYDVNARIKNRIGEITSDDDIN